MPNTFTIYFSGKYIKNVPFYSMTVYFKVNTVHLIRWRALAYELQIPMWWFLECAMNQNGRIVRIRFLEIKFKSYLRGSAYRYTCVLKLNMVESISVLSGLS